MATGLPVLERTRTNERTRGHLAAYGKLSGGAGTKADRAEEEARAQSFNSCIAENYQKLMDPTLHTAEEIMGIEQPVVEEPVSYSSPEEYARATLYPERERPVAMPERRVPQQPQRQRVTEDIFRADSPINAHALLYGDPVEEEEQPVMQAAPAYAPARPQIEVSPELAQPQESLAPEAEVFEEEDEDLAPTATTIQYRTAREEKRTIVEEKKGHAMTTQGKLLMAIYAVVVVVILALIIINTSVLRTIDASIADRRADLAAATAYAEELQEDIDYLTDSETIINRAEEELGMVRG